MIDQFVHGSSKAKAGDGDPTSVDTANPATGKQVDAGYTKIETDTGDGGDKPDGQYEKPHVSIGTNQTIHIMASQSGVTGKCSHVHRK